MILMMTMMVMLTLMTMKIITTLPVFPLLPEMNSINSKFLVFSKGSKDIFKVSSLPFVERLGRRLKLSLISGDDKQRRG